MEIILRILYFNRSRFEHNYTVPQRLFFCYIRGKTILFKYRSSKNKNKKNKVCAHHTLIVCCQKELNNRLATLLKREMRYLLLFLE